MKYDQAYFLARENRALAQPNPARQRRNFLRRAWEVSSVCLADAENDGDEPRAEAERANMARLESVMERENLSPPEAQ